MKFLRFFFFKTVFFLVNLFILINTNKAFPAPQAQNPQPFKSFALFKASYNSIMDNDVKGGIAGTAFFVTKNIAITAYHVLNDSTLKPNLNHTKTQLWLLNKMGGIIELKKYKYTLKYFPGKDITLIVFNKPVVKDDYVFQIDFENFNTFTNKNDLQIYSENIKSEGYRADSLVKATLAWSSHNLTVKEIHFLPQESHKGAIELITQISISATDVQLHNIQCLKLSYGSVLGMSGGPTLKNGKIIGVNSFGFPAGENIKTSTFAISAKEIYAILSPFIQI